MSDHHDLTVDELRDQLRERGLKVSGSKDELVERLADHDRVEPTSRAATTLRDVVARVTDDFHEITGLAPERTSGMTRTDDGWRALVDVVEVSRIPRATDVMATYEVTADAEGALVAFDRLRRFRRSEATA